MNQTLSLWLRASGTGFVRAWAAYGRVVRLAMRQYVADAGLEFDGESALKWLQKSHDAGDKKGSLELSLLLVEEPTLGICPREGEDMLRQLARTDPEARYEIGVRLLEGGRPPSESGGRLRIHALSGRRRLRYRAVQNSVFGYRLVSF